jgi:hypothetical protein
VKTLSILTFVNPMYRDVNGDLIPTNLWGIPLLGYVWDKNCPHGYGYGTKYLPIG